MSLSVCLITRNEEKKIGQALRSVAGLADEVIVADTGSTDRTTEAAAELGARVFPFPWQDDFGTAQNFALDRATGDWVLWLNPDEELLMSSHGLVRECLARGDAFAYFVRRQELVRPDQADYFTEAADLRLYRRTAEVRYVGRCQPRFVTPLQELARRDQKNIYVSAVTLRRHAYLSPVTEPKLRWAARLLELELRDRPGQLHYLIEYGRTLLLLRDPRAQAVLAEAAGQVASAREAPSAPEPTVQRLLEHVLTAPPEADPGGLSREQARELALRWFPASPPLLWTLAQSAFQQRDFRQAVGFLEKLLGLGKTLAYDKTATFDPSIVGDAALMNLGLCYRQMLELDKAEACFQQLLNRPASQAQAAQHLADVQALKRQSPQTLQFLGYLDVLERAGTPDARQALETVAQSQPPSLLTRQAQEALRRLNILQAGRTGIQA